jgi:hypothetical protein
LDHWRGDAEIRLNELEIGVRLQCPGGARQDIDAVTRGKQLFGEGLSDSGTTTCDDVVFHFAKILGVMFAKANGNERLKRNIFDANKPL